MRLGTSAGSLVRILSSRQNLVGAVYQIWDTQTNPGHHATKRTDLEGCQKVACTAQKLQRCQLKTTSDHPPVGAPETKISRRHGTSRSAGPGGRVGPTCKSSQRVRRAEGAGSKTRAQPLSTSRNRRLAKPNRSRSWHSKKGTGRQPDTGYAEPHGGAAA